MPGATSLYTHIDAIMSGITRLPCEIIASIFREFNNIRFLLPSLLTCRHFYTAYLENPSLQQDILQRQIGDALLPTAIAVHSLKSLEVGKASAAIHQILETLYSHPARLREEMKSMSLPEMTRIGHRHEVVRDLASTFGKTAWSLMFSEPLLFSDLEHLRFCRALYRFEILCTLIHKFGDERNSMDVPQGPRIELLARHTPWENEQIACAHDFAEDCLMEGESGHDMLRTMLRR